MTTQQSFEYAQARLILARAVGDTPEILIWQSHVNYWIAKIGGQQ